MSWLITPQQKNKGLLDQFTGAAAAYSLRDLTLLRSGPVVRVRRSSDNTETDFTAAQVSDGSLAAWVGAGNNGFVRTWYDQSGNNRHATQATIANQPQIVSGGSLAQENSKPSLRFNGTSHRLILPTIAFSMNALSVNVLCKTDVSAGSQVAFASIDPNRAYAPAIFSSTYYVGYGASSVAFNFGASDVTSRYLIQLNSGSSNANAWRNGVASSAIPSSAASEAGTDITIGCYDKRTGSLSSNSFWNGTIQEVIFYTSDQTSNQSGIATNINAHYAIY